MEACSAFTCSHPLYEEVFSQAMESIYQYALVPGICGSIFRAGEHYNTAWIRDSAINCLFGGSLLFSDEAKNTLLSVVEKEGKETCIIQDDQWWDSMIWIIAAMRHYNITCDTEFLHTAYTAGMNNLAILDQIHFDREKGLYRGPSFFNDGIAGYPAALYTAEVSSSSALDHCTVSTCFCLSTNCIYLWALEILAEMEQICTQGSGLRWRKRSRELRNMIQHKFFKENSKPLYLLDSAGNEYQYSESSGIAFAILSGCLSNADAREALGGLHSLKYGVPSIWPHFDGFSAQNPGRHGASIWPMVNGLLALAAGQVGEADVLARQLDTIALLAKKSQWDFREVYNGETGLPDGGWQIADRPDFGGLIVSSAPDGSGCYHWLSCHRQTWSATAFLGAVIYGVFGLRIARDHITLVPCIPSAMSRLCLADIPLDGHLMTIEITGNGTRIESISADGEMCIDGIIKRPLCKDLWLRCSMQP